MKILLLILLLFGFNFNIKAQFYITHIRIIVRDNTGKVIENASVEFSPLDKERKKPQYFKNGDFHEWTEIGNKVRSKEFLLKVSATSYENFEQEIPFDRIQGYEVKLNPKDSNLTATLEILTNIHGQVTDENGKPIENVKVIAETADGRVYKTLTTNAGFYGLYLPKGNVRIKFVNSKFPEPVFNNLEVKAENHTRFVTKVCLQCKQKIQK